MNETTTDNFWDDLKRELGDIRQTLRHSWHSISVDIRNALRQVRQIQLDYVVITMGGPLPERNWPPRSFLQRQLPLPPLPQSLESLNAQFQAIADAPNVKGVVLIVQELAAGLATLQNVRQAMTRLRAAGKEVIAYTAYLDLPHYFVATAADRIIAPPGGQFEVFGLRTEVVFLKDALTRIGVQADVVQISPYKTAGNALSESEMTPAQREQLSWLLDEEFDLITTAIADGRHQSPAEILALINQAPFSAAQAQQHGLIDHLAYEDELSLLLAQGEKDSPADGVEPETAVGGAAPHTTSPRRQVSLDIWDHAFPQLLEKARHPTRQYIGVVSLEGGIVMGSSRRPPIDLPIPFFGGPMAGEQTLVRLLRQVEQESQMAALIFHVDSGGGSALASDLIGREIQRIGQKKPVLVYMGNVAASGGYYVSAPAQHIMCQSGTITGSIGVITARLSTQGVYEKLSLNPVHLDRGDRVGLYRNIAPMTDAERQIFWDGVMTTYEQFKQVVANGRNLPYEDLDTICLGRVWSGRQAQTHGLVDSHGDFVDAVHQAAKLAGLPTDDHHFLPVVNFYPKGDDHLSPLPFAPETRTRLEDWLSGKTWQQWQGQPLLLQPQHIRFW